MLKEMMEWERGMCLLMHLCLWFSKGFSLELHGSLWKDCSLCVHSESLALHLTLLTAQPREYSSPFPTRHLFISQYLSTDTRYHISSTDHMTWHACQPAPSPEEAQGCCGDEDLGGRFGESEATLPWQSMSLGKGYIGSLRHLLLQLFACFCLFPNNCFTLMREQYLTFNKVIDNSVSYLTNFTSHSCLILTIQFTAVI